MGTTRFSILDVPQKQKLVQTWSTHLSERRHVSDLRSKAIDSSLQVLRRMRARTAAPSAPAPHPPPLSESRGEKENNLGDMRNGTLGHLRKASTREWIWFLQGHASKSRKWCSTVLIKSKGMRPLNHRDVKPTVEKMLCKGTYHEQTDSLLNCCCFGRLDSQTRLVTNSRKWPRKYNGHEASHRRV